MISFCIFGSQARGTADNFSDFDLLLIGKNDKQLGLFTKRWERRGWNVSAYEICELQKLSQKNSLFIQHIKSEGKIVHDKTGQLRRILDSYKPSTSYVPQRNDAIKQILALPESVDNSEVNACLTDIACVLFRNFAILHLASRQIYEFSHDNLMNSITSEFGMHEGMRTALMMLRSAKHAYRNRLPIDSCVHLLSNVKAATLYVANTIKDLSESAITAGTHNDLYIQLRYRELELVAKYGIRYLDTLPRNHPLSIEWLSFRKYRSYPKDKVKLH